MKKSILKALAILSTLGAVAGLSLYLVFLASQPRLVVLSGNTPSVLSQAQAVSAANPTAPLRVVIGMKVRNEAQLNQLIADQGDQNSLRYRQWISPSDFLAQYAPAQSDVDSAVNYFKAQGLTVAEVTPNRMLIVLEGTVSQFESVMSVTVKSYTLANVAGVPNGIYLSNTSDPFLPAPIASLVDSITGLNDVAQGQSRAVEDTTVPHSVQGPDGYTPAQIAQIYGFPSVVHPSGRYTLSGAGRTLAVATAYTYQRQDLEAYLNAFGIKRTGKITDVPVGGASSIINVETTLDVETVAAQAPGADLLVYESVDPKMGSLALMYSNIATDNKADAVSISWGLCEDMSGAAIVRTDSIIFKQIAAQGIAVFAATGDDGAYDCPLKFKHYSVEYPSSDPNVTSVGGTSLLAYENKRYFELAWSGAGGGMSKVFGRPFYQYGPGVGDVRRRHMADVAMNANPQTGYAIFFNGEWVVYGGTSVSTPEWVSVWILATEAAGERLGPANPLIYRVARSTAYSKLFIDITYGGNGGKFGGGYPAGTAYDHPTGWGVPEVEPLIEWLAGHPVPHKEVSPAAPATSNPTGDDGFKGGH